MSQKLDDKVILRVLREQRAKQLNVLKEELDVNVNLDGQEKKVIAPGLKIKSKEGILFTVDAIGQNSAVIKDPNGETSHISDQELEDNFDL